MTQPRQQLSLLGLFCLFIICLGCSEEQTSGGTASEGESFIYGTLEDSSGTAISSATVVLARIAITEEGSETSDSDTTLTDSTGRFEFRPETEGDFILSAKQGNDSSSLNSIVSGIHWSPSLQDSILKIEGVPLLPPIEISGSITGLKSCSDKPIHIFVPGTPAKALLTREGHFRLPPIPSGQLELGVLCDDAVQFIPLYLPKNCPKIHLEKLPLIAPDTFADNGYTPYPTSQKYSVIAGIPPDGLGPNCPEGNVGPLAGGDMPKWGAPSPHHPRPPMH